MPILSVLLTLTLAQAASPQPTAPSLKFAWPDGVVATVEAERIKEQKQGKTEKKSSVRARYRMEVLPHAEGRLVRRADYTLLTPPPTIATDGDALGEIVGAMTPSIVIGADGGFVRVDNPAAVKATLDAMLAPLRAEGGLKTFDQVMASFASVDFIAAAAAQDWQALVTSWIELPLSTTPLPFSGDVPFPLFPDLTIQLNGSTRMVEKRECRRLGTPRPCALFEMTSAIDPASFAEVMKRMFAGSKEMAGVKFDTYDVKTTTRVVLETDTMLPHEFSISRLVTIGVTVPGESRTEGAVLNVQSSRFTYLK